MKNSNIIFLDFDGVLNSVKNYRHLREQGLPTDDRPHLVRTDPETGPTSENAITAIESPIRFA